MISTEYDYSLWSFVATPRTLPSDRPCLEVQNASISFDIEFSFLTRGAWAATGCVSWFVCSLVCVIFSEVMTSRKNLV